jgi:hypothetical protein
MTNYFQRGANWTDEEVERLVGLVEKYKLQLYGSFSGLASQGGRGTTNEEKTKVWDLIANEFQGRYPINNVSFNIRTLCPFI